MKKLYRITWVTLALTAAMLLPAAAADEIEDLPGGATVGTEDFSQDQGKYDILPHAEEGAQAATAPGPVMDADGEMDAPADISPWEADPSYGVDDGVFTDENGLFPSANALYDYWQKKGWPETVGDVWSADGTMENLIVAVVDGDQAVIDGIKAQMADPDCLTFTACKYSHAELEQAMEEITVEMKNGVACILSAGMGVRDNDFSVNGQPCVHVTVSTLQPGAAEWAETLESRYGDLVELEVGEYANAVNQEFAAGNNMPVPGGGRTEDGTVDGGGGAWYRYLWALPAAALAGLILLVPALRRRMVLSTADGRTVVSDGKVDRAQAEAMVRESAVRPDRDNWDAIQEKLP